MSYRFLILIFLSTFIFPNLSQASEPSVKYPALYVSDPWSFEAISQEVNKQYGDQGVTSKQITRNQGLLEFLYVPPFNILSLVYFKTIGRDSDSVSSEITKICRLEITIENKISCIAQRIASYARSLPKYSSNGITLDYRTFCAIAANLFFKSFNSLNIKGARAGFMESSWMLPRALHVVSSVFITNSEGIVYSYVIDVGNLPDILFPLSDPAIRWHKNRTDSSKNKFPDLKLL